MPNKKRGASELPFTAKDDNENKTTKHKSKQKVVANITAIILLMAVTLFTAAYFASKEATALKRCVYVFEYVCMYVLLMLMAMTLFTAAYFASKKLYISEKVCMCVCVCTYACINRAYGRDAVYCCIFCF